MHSPTSRVATVLLVAAGIAHAHAHASTPDPRDRPSILAMQGEYLVDFAFDETVLLKPGYARAPAQRSGGDEVVIVVQDSPERVVLQHLLEPTQHHDLDHRSDVQRRCSGIEANVARHDLL